MSCLHLNVKCLNRSQIVCTVSTDSKLKQIWWERRKLQYTVQYRLWYMCFSGICVAPEVCLGRNDTSIMSRRLSKWALNKSKNLILDWIADRGCAGTSIRGQEIPGSERCSLAMNTWAASWSPTLWDADLRCARTSRICQQWLPLCYTSVSPCLIFWHNYWISPRLTILPNGMCKYALPDLSWWYAQDSPIAHGLRS